MCMWSVSVRTDAPVGARLKYLLCSRQKQRFFFALSSRPSLPYGKEQSSFDRDIARPTLSWPCPGVPPTPTTSRRRREWSTWHHFRRWSSARTAWGTCARSAGWPASRPFATSICGSTRSWLWSRLRPGRVSVSETGPRAAAVTAAAATRAAAGPGKTSSGCYRSWSSSTAEGWPPTKGCCSVRDETGTSTRSTSATSSNSSSSSTTTSTVASGKKLGALSPNNAARGTSRDATDPHGVGSSNSGRGRNRWKDPLRQAPTNPTESRCARKGRIPAPPPALRPQAAAAVGVTAKAPLSHRKR